MPLTTGLPVSRLVAVDISLTTPGAIAAALNSALVLGTSGVIDATERMREYGSISEVAGDFATTSEEYLAANLWFSQTPRPSNLFIGAWIKTAAAGALIGAPLSTSEQSLLAWTVITTGGFHIVINGVPQEVTGLNFSAAANLNAVAALITAKLVSPAGTCIWNANQDRFEIRSNTAGITSTVSFLTAPASGPDISPQLKMTAASSGAYTVAGQAGETALSATAVIDGLFSNTWYALVCPSATDADHQQLAAYCEASAAPHYYGVTTQEAGVLSAVSTTDIAAVLKGFGYNKTAVQYSSSSKYAIMSYLGRILTTSWTGQNTTITLMFKQEPGVTPEQLSSTQASVVQGKNCNIYAAYANGAFLIQYGVSCSGEYTDTIVGADSLANDVQGAVFNVLYTSPTKVPQTDPGMGLLVNATSAVCANYVRNGFLATGTWTAPGFGTLKTGDLVVQGFYVFAASILTQTAAERAARQAPVITVGAKCAGAIHQANVLIFINQ